LARARAEVRRRWPGAQVRVVDGAPGVAIRREAQRQRAHAIVVGCGGHGLVGRLVPGSVSRGVVTRARGGGLVVKARPGRPRRFLAALDGSRARGAGPWGSSLDWRPRPEAERGSAPSSRPSGRRRCRSCRRRCVRPWRPGGRQRSDERATGAGSAGARRPRARGNRLSGGGRVPLRRPPRPAARRRRRPVGGEGGGRPRGRRHGAAAPR
jgi:hypothetical protein